MWWMENFGEKMRRKTFLVGVWLERGEGKKLLGPRCFLPEPTKMFSLQNREKNEWEEFRVYLFGGEIGWMKNFGKKMERKTFLVGVWLERG